MSGKYSYFSSTGLSRPDVKGVYGPCQPCWLEVVQRRSLMDVMLPRLRMVCEHDIVDLAMVEKGRTTCMFMYL
jgi:hypothetical protein